MFLPVAALQRAGRLAHCLHDIDGLTGFADYLLPQLTAPIGCDSVTYNHVGPHVRAQAAAAEAAVFDGKKDSSALTARELGASCRCLTGGASARLAGHARRTSG